MDGDHRAREHFDRARHAAEAGQPEYAIELFLSGLAIEPDNLDAHRELWRLAVKRKAGGGKDLGMIKKMMLRSAIARVADATQSLAYDPGNVDVMVELARHADAAGHICTADWAEKLIRRASQT